MYGILEMIIYIFAFYNIVVTYQFHVWTPSNSFHTEDKQDRRMRKSPQAHFPDRPLEAVTLHVLYTVVMQNNHEIVITP